MVTTMGIIQDGDKETFIKMPSGFGKYNGKNYYFDHNKSYKIGNDSICFFKAEKNQPITLPHKDKIIIVNVNYRKKIKEFFGRIEL